MKVESRLGKGLSAFFENKGQEAPVSTNAAGKHAETTAGHGGVAYLPIGNIRPNPSQPRKMFLEEQIKELANSIEKNGLLQPILVRKTGNASFEIIAGERRWRAAQLAGIQEIPAIIKEFTDRQAFEIGLIENLQRENLSPIEEANGYKKLMLDFDYTQEDISKLVNKSRSYVGNILRLLSLPKEVQKMVNDREISYTIARTLVGSDNPMKDARAIVKERLNVREAEEKKTTKKAQPEFEPELESLRETLENVLETKVVIKFKNNKGEISIKFDNLSSLDNIITKFNKL